MRARISRFLVRGNWGIVLAAQGAGRGGLAVHGRGGAGADQVGGGQLGPGFGNYQARGPRPTLGAGAVTWLC